MMKKTRMKRGDIGLADLAIAVHTLDLTDPEQLRAVGRCLGFGNLRRTERTQGRGGFEQRLKNRHQQPERKPQRATSDEPGTVTPAPPELPDRILPSELTPLDPIEASDEPPADWLNAPPIENRRPRALPRLPLLPKNTANGVLGAAVCTRQPGRMLDLDVLVQRIVGRRPLQPLPRLPTTTLSRGVQLLLDRGESMTPFYPDQQDLADALATVVGEPQLEVFEFDGQPIAARRWDPASRQGKWRSQRGRPVLFSTDFGLGMSRGLRSPMSGRDWHRLTRRLIRAGTPVVFLIPLPPGDWPRWLERGFNPIHWDPRTRAETVRSLIGEGHRSAP